MSISPLIEVIDLLAELGRQILENKPASSGVLGRETDEADGTPSEAEEVI